MEGAKALPAPSAAKETGNSPGDSLEPANEDVEPVRDPLQGDLLVIVHALKCARRAEQGLDAGQHLVHAPEASCDAGQDCAAEVHQYVLKIGPALSRFLDRRASRVILHEARIAVLEFRTVHVLHQGRDLLLDRRIGQKRESAKSLRSEQFAFRNPRAP